MAPKVVHRKKYRTGCNAKTLKQISFRVSKDVLDFFEINSCDENGVKLSRAKVLERAIAIARPIMMAPPRRQKW